jgi:hypothetical protein
MEVENAHSVYLEYILLYFFSNKQMCNKTISPMKLMHRIKHSQASYDEPGRIQLYEFLDLLLWYIPCLFLVYILLFIIKMTVA